MDWKSLNEFRFWSQKVLPLVYDDSISYYEVLCKVVDYINQMLENEQTLYDMFEPLTGTIGELETKFNNLQSSVNTALLDLNERCYNLETEVESNYVELKAYIDNINEGLTRQMNEVTAGYNTLLSLCISLQAQIKSGDTLTLTKSKSYTDDEIKKLKQLLINNIGSWYVIDPLDGQLKNIQIVIDELFEWITYASLTCWEFDAKEWTCEYWDSLGYTCTEFDVFGKFIEFISGDNFVTKDDIADFVKREQLEYYALKTDLEPYALKRDLILYNPVTGLRGTMQQVVDTLIAFHANGNNCYTLDGLDYTATEYDAIRYTAYDFDFLGLVRRAGYFINPLTGIKSPLQVILNELAGLHQMGLSATEFDGLNADCDTIDALEYTAYEFDFLGITFFANAGMVSVTTGITATQYQNLVVDSHGVVHVLDLTSP